MTVESGEQHNEATVDFAHIKLLDFHFFFGDKVSESILAELSSKKNVLCVGNTVCPDEIKSCSHKVAAFLEKNNNDE